MDDDDDLFSDSLAKTEKKVRLETNVSILEDPTYMKKFSYTSKGGSYIEVEQKKAPPVPKSRPRGKRRKPKQVEKKKKPKPKPKAVPRAKRERKVIKRRKRGNEPSALLDRRKKGTRVIRKPVAAKPRKPEVVVKMRDGEETKENLFGETKMKVKRQKKVKIETIDASLDDDLEMLENEQKEFKKVSKVKKRTIQTKRKKKPRKKKVDDDLDLFGDMDSAVKADDLSKTDISKYIEEASGKDEGGDDDLFNLFE